MDASDGYSLYLLIFFELSDKFCHCIGLYVSNIWCLHWLIFSPRHTSSSNVYLVFYGDCYISGGGLNLERHDY